MSTTLPRLLDVRQIMVELNVKRATAERVMRECEPIQIGRRYFLTDEQILNYLRKASSTSGGTS